MRESFEPSGPTDLVAMVGGLQLGGKAQPATHMIVFSDGQNHGPVTFAADCDFKVLTMGLGQEQSIPMVHRDALAETAAGYLMA